MKTLITALFLGISMIASAQKFGYVDTEYILEQMPEYRSAQKQLDALADEWQKEIEKRYAEIDKLYKSYEAEKPLLTEELKKKKEQEILDKEKAVKDYQKQKFGFEGDLFKKRQELVKPIQDKVFEAVQKVAKEKVVDFIFDKSSDLIMLYTNAKYDYSDDVLEILGITPGESKDKDKDKPGNK